MNSGINSKTEKIFQFFWTAFFILITVIAMIPILRVISVSFSSKDAITAGRVGGAAGFPVSSLCGDTAAATARQAADVVCGGSCFFCLFFPDPKRFINSTTTNAITMITITQKPAVL